MISPTDEIRGTIELYHKEGSVDQSDKYMLDGVFYLRETQVKEVMTHRKDIKDINIDQNIDDIAKEIKEIKHSRIPVWKDSPDNIIGILSSKDFLHSFIENQDLKKINLQELVVEPMFIHENTRLDELLSEFRTRKIRSAIVIDEYGDIQGLITLSDILEEVVGLIQDEHDNDRDNIIIQKNTCLVKGKVTIRDLNRILNWNLPEEEATTIAGLLINEAQRIPDENESFDFYGFHFKIITKNSNQLTNIEISKINDE